MFIWPSAQDLPARAAVTGGVAAPLTSSGSESLNSQPSPVQLMKDWHDLSVSSSRRNCHSWIGPLPAEQRGREALFKKPGGDSVEAFRWVRLGGMEGNGGIKKKRQVWEKSATLPGLKMLNIYSLNYSLVSAEGTM